MCGLAGFIQKEHDRERLAKMLVAIAHRGPDGEGSWYKSKDAWNIHLGHRRLSILDIPGGGQPFTTEDGEYSLVFNGEIFNFAALRTKLEAQGKTFYSRSDTEVLLKWLITYGTQGLAELNGMFAFAFWNHRKGSLLLARDRAGIKPLYYCFKEDGSLFFASELSGVLAAKVFSQPRLSQDAMLGYFFSDYIAAPLSAVSGISKVPPGTWMEWQNGKISDAQNFWSLPTRESANQNQIDAKQLEPLLSLSIERQMMADVPVGVLLSGGIDSSLIAVLAARQSREPLKTFSVQFEEAEFNEGPYAALVAKQIKSQHFTMTLSLGLFMDGFEQIVRTLDEPLGDPSYIPTAHLCRFAAKEVKVALGGDGGDELFGGYPTYNAHSLLEPLPIFRQSVINCFSPLIAALPARSERHQSLEWKLKRLFLRWDDDPCRRQLRWMSSLDLPDLQNAFPQSTGSSKIPQFSFCHDLQKGNFKVPYQAMLLDFATYLPGSVLSKVDRASMQFGLEVRPPFLDNDMIQFCQQNYNAASASLFLKKKLLRDLARHLLPAEIVNRPKKGFGIPLGAWIKNPKIKSELNAILRDSPLWENKILAQSFFQNALDAHTNGSKDCAKPLWNLLVLDRWVRKHSVSW